MLEFLKDIASVFQPQRRIVIARELTKLHETFLRCKVAEAATLVEADPNMEKGEFVVLLEGASQQRHKEELTSEQTRVLKLLLEECSVKTAASLTAKITGARKELAYQAALRLGDKKG